MPETRNTASRVWRTVIRRSNGIESLKERNASEAMQERLKASAKEAGAWMKSSASDSGRQMAASATESFSRAKNSASIVAKDARQKVSTQIQARNPAKKMNDALRRLRNLALGIGAVLLFGYGFGQAAPYAIRDVYLELVC